MTNYVPCAAEANLLRRIQHAIGERRQENRKGSTVCIQLQLIVEPHGESLLIVGNAGKAEKIGVIDK